MRNIWRRLLVMHVILASDLRAALVEIALHNELNPLTILDTISTPNHKIVRAETREDITISGADDLFGTGPATRIIYTQSKIPLSSITGIMDDEYLILDKNLYKTTDIPKQKDFKVLKPHKSTAAEVKNNILSWSQENNLTISNTTLQQLSGIATYEPLLEILNVLRAAPEVGEDYLKAAIVPDATPLFWLQLTDSGAVEHVKKWFQLVPEYDVQLGLSLLATKALKNGGGFSKRAMRAIIDADLSMKSANKMSPLTVFRRALYKIAHG